MRNANTSHTISYSAMVKKWKINPKFVSGIRSQPKVNNFCRPPLARAYRVWWTWLTE